MSKVAHAYASQMNVVGVGGLDQADAMRAFVNDRDVDNFVHLSEETGVVWRPDMVAWTTTRSLSWATSCTVQVRSPKAVRNQRAVADRAAGPVPRVSGGSVLASRLTASAV